ncbi:hypothetical protein H920_13124 [Fukomys damarensis]|uniref:Uncharacterized protein n=1 Tax=Fukomys damarensis TaxID=885580 RepID=A0A091D381_FUKDA|nr:hypothetical protein H920_13124 [Fukomys damarensis]
MLVVVMLAGVRGDHGGDGNNAATIQTVVTMLAVGLCAWTELCSSPDEIIKAL